MRLDQIMKQLPPEYQKDLLHSIREEFVHDARTIVVLDDDPTGTQTCYDVNVLTSWEVPLITDALIPKPSVLFILTNSRSLTEQEAVQLALEIGQNLKAAVKASGREIVVVSRSDSTLRGHFPAEVDAVAKALDMQDAVQVLIPAFIEGGRFTLDNVHYLVEDEELVPVSETPFARDVVFGYRHADLKQWVEEKTKGRVRAEQVRSLSLEDIRTGGPQQVKDKLVSCKPRAVCVANAVSYRDLEVVVMGLMMAEKEGRKFLYRTSATFVPIRAGLVSGKAYKPRKEDVRSPHGALVVVGSHVPKTTGQLSFLLSQGNYKSLEVNVGEILHSTESASLAKAMIQQTDQWLASGENVVLYTSRKLEAGHDMESSLKINAFVSAFLIHIMQRIGVRPKFMVAKGGITSSDLASKGLSAQKALILGPVIPGVPVWQLKEESKFPGLLYVVFPGNIGDQKVLAEVCTMLDL